MKTLSFIAPKYKQIAKACFGLLPSIGKVTVFYYNETSRKVCAFEQNSRNKTTPLFVTENLFNIQKERKKGQAIQWVDELIGNVNKKSGKQLSLTDESKLTILCVKIKNQTDGNYDLIYIELNEGINQFELAIKKRELSTDNKAIIEKMILNFIQYQLNEIEDNASTFKMIITSVNEQRKNINTLGSELAQLKKNYYLSVLRYIDEIVKRLEKENLVQFSFTEDAKSKLGEYKGSFSKLEKIVENALSIGVNLSNGTKEIVIPAEFVLLSHNELESSSEQNIHVSKYEKTVSYLDKYESAAQKLLLNDMSINGKNVARFCSPPISAAAITINLKSHSLKIQYLFNEYPDKWNVLREHFRPVQNVLKDAS